MVYDLAIHWQQQLVYRSDLVKASRFFEQTVCWKAIEMELESVLTRVRCLEAQWVCLSVSCLDLG